MNLKKYLTAEAVIPNLKSAQKEEILLELIEVMCKSGKLGYDRLDEAMASLIKREGKMSTGIQDGIAIPHARISGIKDIIAAIGIKAEGVDFKSLDEKPSRIFILTLSPEDRPVPHVQFLAEFMQKLQLESFRERLLKAVTSQEVLALLFNS